MDPLFASATLGWGLVAVRLWALFRVHPIWRLAIGPWWNVVAAGLAGIVALGAGSAVTTTPVATTWVELGVLVGVELVVGTLLGLLVSLPGYALLGAASSSAVALRTSATPVVGLGVALILATALSLGLHRPLLVGALDTVAVVPLGEPLAAPLTAAAISAAAQTTVLLALALATPALLAGVTFEVAARLVGRGPGPATAAADTAPWFRLAAALVALGASWSAYAPSWTTALLPP